MEIDFLKAILFFVRGQDSGLIFDADKFLRGHSLALKPSCLGRTLDTPALELTTQQIIDDSVTLLKGTSHFWFVNTCMVKKIVQFVSKCGQV